MPSWLLWLSPVPLATLGAIAWTAWSGRRRGPGDTRASVQRHERFRAALAVPPPSGTAPRSDAPPGPSSDPRSDPSTSTDAAGR